MGQILAVCISEKKGTPKRPVAEGRLVKDLGLEGDAHAGLGLRQISLLGLESLAKMRAKGLELNYGDFAENLTVAGLNLPALPIGTRLAAGEEAMLRVTRIGKECHGHCEVYRRVGDCVMPREGIFAEVLRGGKVRPGQAIAVLPDYRFGVITVSDKGSRGERVDESGPLLAGLLLPWGEVVKYGIVPDEKPVLVETMVKMADEDRLDLIFTTGGTGFSPRDVTPEATLEAVERLAPGIPEAMRRAGLERTPKAMLSRAVAGLRGRSVIINLPGSPRAVAENLEVLYPVIRHLLEIAGGNGGECGESLKNSNETGAD